MIEAPEFLPLGSVVLLSGSDHKVMIIARGTIAIGKNGKEYYDYAGCLYPEGMLGEAFIYFNHSVIGEVVYRGYESDEDAPIITQIVEVLKMTDLKRGEPKPTEEW